MQSEIDPRIAYTVVGIVAILAIGFFVMRMRTPAFNPQTTGSEAYQQHIQRGGSLYQPPPGSGIPGPR